jgi:chromate transport protein ChrA
MLAIVLAIVVIPLLWLFMTRSAPVDPVVKRVAVGLVIACVAAVLAVRSPLAALAFLVVVGLVVWLRMRGRGGDDPGDDGRDPPDDPDPSPDPGQRLDPDAFDRAREQWEQELRERR